MTTVSVSNARAHLPALLNAVADEPVFIERRGHRAAVIISPERYEQMLDALEEQEDVAAFDASLRTSARTERNPGRNHAVGTGPAASCLKGTARPSGLQISVAVGNASPRWPAQPPRSSEWERWASSTNDNDVPSVRKQQVLGS
ncbi:type II toxin-antitoxin system Phd/YefM family antitoxin [Arthrobacter silvisoli]|uniref:type II toxin-antitoxin system Phd/YefM family antitoxin n=1 Tax=Arthrobacter silvisoli TaxID=2291022 RepID=UPI00319EB09C